MSGEDTLTILIIDDESSNIIALSGILRPSYLVLAAKDGRSGIELAKKNLPDLILLDVIMPGMSGFEVLAELKNSERTRDVPIIFITAKDSSRDEERGLHLGAVDYITRPFNDAIVKLRVETHLKIIERMRSAERLGMIDELTEIPNRRGFDRQLETEWKRAIRDRTPISLLMIDIDGFKLFNDSYGHAHGDAALKTVAQVIARALQRPADYAARWGGEEFAVLLPRTDMDGAATIANRIHADIGAAAVPCSDGETRIAVSIGVNSEAPESGAEPDEFVSKADKALYCAKESGRNKVVAYTPDGD